MRNNKLEQYVKEQANKRFEEMMENAQECIDIADLNNWGEPLENLFTYTTKEGATYQIVINNMNYNEGLREVQAELYLAATWTNRETGQEEFKREFLKAGTVNKLIKVAQKNLFSLYNWEAA